MQPRAVACPLCGKNEPRVAAGVSMYQSQTKSGPIWIQSVVEELRFAWILGLTSCDRSTRSQSLFPPFRRLFSGQPANI
jgi:hypothetical protein